MSSRQEKTRESGGPGRVCAMGVVSLLTKGVVSEDFLCSPTHLTSPSLSPPAFLPFFFLYCLDLQRLWFRECGSGSERGGVIGMILHFKPGIKHPHPQPCLPIRPSTGVSLALVSDVLLQKFSCPSLSFAFLLTRLEQETGREGD